MRTWQRDRSWRFSGWATCLFAACCVSAPFARGEESSSAKATTPDALVQEALSQEIGGEASDRSRPLQAALAASPRHEPARWHSGYVRTGGKWERYDELSNRLTDDRRLARYRSRRENTPDTLQGQLEMADWCRRQRLFPQEQAHLARVLEFDAEHADARARLGFVRAGSTWVRRAEIEDAGRSAAAEREALATWIPRLKGLADDLAADSPRRRAAAENRLDEIDDLAAIGALELVSAEGERPALCVIAKLERFSGRAATESLARHAVFAPWPAVRRAAAECLADRSEDAYVPLLLAALHTPAQARGSVYTAADGRLVHVLAVTRESQDQREMAVLETAFTGVDSRAGRRLAEVEARERTEDVARTVERHNAETQAANEIVCQTLTVATGAMGNLTPEEWWQWWTDRNEVYTPGAKPVWTRYERDSVDVAPSPPPRTSMDCLAAGTPVWTDRGPQAIENIQVGDLVLSQHPETGELAYKPVLRTTVRPPAALVRLTIEGRALTASGGHPLWVSGRGWVRARELAVGDRLHGIDGTRTIDGVEDAGRDQTYNLIVADFNTYFAGEQLVLSHDNTVRQATETVVPGLIGGE